MSRFWNFLVLLRSQLWFVPLLMSAGAIGLALLVIRFGRLLTGTSESWWLYSGDVDTARDLLSTLLSGMITMTSLIVSVTFVVLALAAQQLGPRLISIFMSDRTIQATFGLFIGTVVYILFVLENLDQSLGSDAVPRLAVTVASGLTGTCLLALFFYLHKVARSIVSDYVIARVSYVLRSAADVLLSQTENESDVDVPTEIAALRQDGWLAIRQGGYVQTIDYKDLVPAAQEADVVLRVAVRPGDFVLESGPHIEVLGKPDRITSADRADLGQSLRSAIDNAFTIGSERSPTQDLEFSIQQMVETALRALPPAMNDLFIASTVIDQLGAAFLLILSRPPQRRIFHDPIGEVRVIADIVDPLQVIRISFRRIRQSGPENPTMLIHLAQAIGKITAALDASDQVDKDRRVSARAILIGELEVIAETATECVHPAQDKAAVLEFVQRTLEQAQQPRQAIKDI